MNLSRFKPEFIILVGGLGLSLMEAQNVTILADRKIRQVWNKIEKNAGQTGRQRQEFYSEEFNPVRRVEEVSNQVCIFDKRVYIKEPHWDVSG
ncbi:hypothetical protein CAG70_05910 [Photobacterium halotolerans]|uniref:Uncharacterized protein n=1 Tax=Photobacterium halotolerans TaxID=265726 RepID=A0A7X4WC25_9GAMM|nr:hypothetical protein [Photobacterium halotolerans]NAW66027.1 hypothetical protein [Photobacterium halotolerans]NAX46535.1 hypothetical protein [Photobacterium halotolerans]